ncbi:hypothetical protein N7455_006433 [Penicillium solitum]|uniref:uncharacterized protein n=1 Tax=Penicillium solitum TaxID=60172 RepID=UPI0018470CF6|nr:hypothetical protein HAV15_011963 [Penicillium sp. str. \
MAEQMKLPICEFVTAVTTHCLASNVNAADATDYTKRVYGALYIQALEDMPGEYSSICGDLMKGSPATLYTQSFTRPVIQRTHFNDSSGPPRPKWVAALVDDYDDGSGDGEGEFDEPSSVMAAKLFPSV